MGGMQIRDKEIFEDQNVRGCPLNLDMWGPPAITGESNRQQSLASELTLFNLKWSRDWLIHQQLHERDTEYSRGQNKKPPNHARVTSNPHLATLSQCRFLIYLSTFSTYFALNF